LSGILRPLLGSQRDAFHQEFRRDFLPDLPAPARGLSGGFRAAAGSRFRLGWPSKLFATFWWSLWWASMNCQAFTNDSLTMMYEGIRGAMAADDALKRPGMEIRFRVRETPDWKKHAGELESEMLNRGMFFDVIDWSEDQAALPFEA
jgi:hypothetical protein